MGRGAKEELLIPVVLRPAPADFAETVRNPGLSAIAEMVGEVVTPNRRGPKRKKIAERREDLPASCFPDFWTRVLSELFTAYSGICSFCCLYIEPGTGDPTVDHMVPKSRNWQLVYEWRNFRLACGQMNSNKGDSDDVLDPFEVEEGFFALELVDFQVVPGPRADGEILSRVRRTIERLKLDQPSKISRQMETYYVSYFAGQISWSYLATRAPFLAKEMRRQGKQLPGDL